MKNQPATIADVPCCVSTLFLGPADVVVFMVPRHASSADIDCLADALKTMPALKGKTMVLRNDIGIIELKRLAKELEE